MAGRAAVRSVSGARASRPPLTAVLWLRTAVARVRHVAKKLAVFACELLTGPF
jgi:hypothetical protein